MNHDFIRLANDMRRAHLLGLGFRIPAMTMRQPVSYTHLRAHET